MRRQATSDTISGTISDTSHSMRKGSPGYVVSSASIRMRHFRQAETDHTDSESDTDNEDEDTTTIPDLADTVSDSDSD
jgi:hypothetical protein